MKRTGSRYQCADCGRHFAGPHAFARHRSEQYAPSHRQCLTAGQMAALGMRRSTHGFWIAPQAREAVA